jgi:acyl carrier protein
MTPSSMTRDQIEAKLTEICRTVFDAPSLVLRDDMTAADVEGWDSLNHIGLIVAVERAFQVRFTVAEISRLNNVGTLIGFIDQKARQL